MREIDYKRFIEKEFQIVNKEMQLVDFKLNAIQNKYLEECSWSDLILKARQQGFSSVITAILCVDFLIMEHSYSVIVADIEENAEMLLDKVKKYLASFQIKNNKKITMKYETTSMLYNSFMDTRISIGTAKNTEFGKSRTITNLHCSEVALYPDIEKIIEGAGQAVVQGGKKIFETTANGFNRFKRLWDDSKAGLTLYKPLFYKASDFYSAEFLADKKKELGRLYPQAYPETDYESFLASGDCYFDTEMLSDFHWKNINNPIPMPKGQEGWLC